MELVLKDELESASKRQKWLEAIEDQIAGHKYGDHEENISFNYLEKSPNSVLISSL